MEMPSIFRRSEEEQAPDVEVQGQDIVIRNTRDGGGEPRPDERRVKMPPTIWK